MYLVRRVLLPLLSVVLGLGGALLVVPGASASVTYLCAGYDGCAKAGMSHAGYKAAGSTMYWRMYAGHNCTNYVAYRMVKSGLPNVRPWSGGGNAEYWGLSMASITDGTPAVGSVAWWAENVRPAGRSGHVAYVEQVISADEIIVSQDSWGGDFSWARITRSGGGWPSGFIHFNDAVLTRTERPRVQGTAKVGERLTASPGVWSPDPTAYRYQWRADGTAITGATAPTFTVSPELQGRQISVRVRVSKTGYSTATAVSRWTPAVLPGQISNTQPPAVTGVPQVDSTLTVSAGTWDPLPDTVGYQWSADGEPIAGATGTTLTPTPDLVGKTLAVTVTAARAGYDPVSVTTPATAAVAPGRLTVTRSAAVSGVPRLGETLTLDPGGVDRADATRTVQWLRSGTPVPGATGTTYTLTAEDLGRRIRARVFYSKPGYTTEKLGTNVTTRVKSLSRLTARAEPLRAGRVRLSVAVAADQVQPVTGVVVVRSQGAVLAELPLLDGARTITLRDLLHGKVVLNVRYRATATTTAAHVREVVRTA